MITADLPRSTAAQPGHSVLEQHFSKTDLFNTRLEVFKDCFTPLHVAKRLAEIDPEQPAILLPNDSATDYETITRKRLWGIIDRLAGWVRRSPLDQLPHRSVIALIDNENERAWFAVLALLGAQFIPLMVNNKMADDEIKHLLEQANCSGVITPALYMPKMKAIAETFESRKLVIAETITLPLSQIEQLPSSDLTLSPSSETDMGKTSMVYHSSGSTGPPKCIPITNTYFIGSGCSNRQPKEDRIRTMTLSPVFHMLGSGIFSSPMGDSPHVPVLPLTKIYPPRPSELIRSLQKAQVSVLTAVPDYFDMLAGYCDSHPEAWKVLSDAKNIHFAGAPMNSATRDKYLEKGICPVSWYGATEFGLGMNGVDNHDPELDPALWLKVSSWMSYRMEPTEIPNTFEFVVLDDYPFFLEGTRNHPNGYRSSDLWEQNPKHPEYFRYVGRRDDLLVHSNGEKTRALVIEDRWKALCKDEIAHVVVIGHQRPRTAALVELNYTNIDNAQEEASAKRKILDALVSVNESVPTFSRIAENMVCFIPRSGRIPLSPKDSPQRKKTLSEFKNEIEELYAPIHSQLSPPQMKVSGRQVARSNFAGSPLSRASTQAEWGSGIVDRVAAVIGISPKEILSKPDVPLFDLGLTSQTAVELQGVLSDALGHPVDSNFIFEYPTIGEILREIGSQPSTAGGMGKIETMPELLKMDTSYANDARAIWRQRRAAIDALSTMTNCGSIAYPNQWTIAGPPREKKGIYVLLTGATGTLGCQLIASLLRNPDIAKVCCLLRGDNPTKRLAESLAKKKVDVRQSLESNQSRLEALSYDMKDSKFGVGAKKYAELISKVDFVIHNAWKMDFNQKVRQFDDDCLESIMHMVKFCVTPGFSRKQLAFISSISAVAGAGIHPIPNEIFGTKQLEFAFPMGYAQSKSIAELMILHAASRLNFDAKIFRCGQLSGDTVHGVWNETDLLAILTCNASKMKMLPKMGHDVSLVPMDVAANCVTEILFSMPTRGCAVFNISNPKTANWEDWIKCLHEVGMDFKVVGLDEYIAEVKKNKSNPATLLLPFLERQVHASNQEVEEIVLDVEETTTNSLSLRRCPKVTAKIAKLCLDAWGVLEAHA